MITEVLKDKLPAQSILNKQAKPTDFLDCYSVRSSLSPRNAAEIITNFPIWVQILLLGRKVLTTPFELLNDAPTAGDKIGPFPVELETDTELIAGFDDKHLDFRVSVISHNGKIYLATWVHPHNLGGRLYLLSILPFHKLIIRNALHRVANQTAA